MAASPCAAANSLTARRTPHCTAASARCACAAASARTARRTSCRTPAARRACTTTGGAARAAARRRPPTTGEKAGTGSARGSKAGAEGLRPAKRKALPETVGLLWIYKSCDANGRACPAVLHLRFFTASTAAG